MSEQVDTLTVEGFSWTNVDSPTRTVLDELNREYAFHHLSIDDCLSVNQRPKIDEYDDYVFIILYFPHEVKHDDEYKIVLERVDIFIGQDFCVTVQSGSKRVNEIFEECKENEAVRNKYMAKGTGYFLYKLLNRLFLDMFPILDRLSKRADVYEDDIFEKKGAEDMLEDILELKKEILEFRRIISPQRPVVAQLEHKNTRFISEDLEVYFDDVVDKIERIWSHLESLNDTLNSIQQTNETIIFHNTNNVIKTLTIFSVTMMPLTLLSGIYGMNLSTLPYASHPSSFHIVTGIMLLVLIAMLIFFKVKKWM